MLDCGLADEHLDACYRADVRFKSRAQIRWIAQAVVARIAINGSGP